MGQKAGAGATALDRTRLQRRLVEAFASATGQARAHDALHHEAAGDVFQLLGDIFAEALETVAAIGASLARRQEPSLHAADDPAGGGASVVFFVAGSRGSGSASAARAISSSSRPELELVEGLRGGAEALPAQTRKLVLELLDQKVAVAQLGPRGQHHRLQSGDIVGQCHEPLRAWRHPSGKGRQREARMIVNSLLINVLSA